MQKLATTSIVLAVLSLGSATSAAETYVTTYVTKTQDERENTRWTLTEWLRIKERMRMMDLWLAMFSDPKADKFRPELNITYGITRGAMTSTDSSIGEGSFDVNGTKQGAQLWLTNLVSSTIGVRMLNIDLGAEMIQRSTGATLAPVQAAIGTSEESATETADARTVKNSVYTGNLRLFGKHIQDSSLVFKYGGYTSQNTISPWTDPAVSNQRRGLVAGAALQVYLLSWLGLSGEYMAYGDSQSVRGSAEQQGHYMETTGFIEVSLLRLIVGSYQESWNLEHDGIVKTSQEKGVTAGAQLSF